jgi:hypothetical protein
MTRIFIVETFKGRGERRRCQTEKRSEVRGKIAEVRTEAHSLRVFPMSFTTWVLNRCNLTFDL